MPVVDVHQHLWPEAFVSALAQRRDVPRLRGSTLELAEGAFELDLAEHDLDRRLAALERDGIEVAVVSLQPTIGFDGELAAVWEDGIKELAAAAGGRLRPLAAGDRVEGFAGACIGAAALADLDAIAPLLDRLERNGSVLFVHPGPAPSTPGRPAWWGGVIGYPAQMHAAFYAWLSHGRNRWPELRVVFAILAGGAPFQLERLAGRGVDVRSTLDPNLYFDVATYGRRAIELCIETFGVQQLVYGSDLPVVDPAPTLQSVRGFGHSVLKLITIDNPSGLFA
jgi:6-methylsalicylate decarboxylase